MAFLDALALRLGRRLPLVLQTEATECGLACLAMIAGYHGHHTGLMELRRRFSVSLKGISLKQLIQTAHRLGLGTRAVKLDLGEEGKIFIDGATTPNTVTNEDKPADATVSIKWDDFLALSEGKLDPMMAFMQGKLKIAGDMMIAQKLAPLLKR